MEHRRQRPSALNNLLKVVCFKWQCTFQGYIMPSQRHGKYGAEHVNMLFRMLRRHSRVDFEPVCITDEPAGIDQDIRILPLWDKCLHLGGCYNRLYVYSEHMKHYIGRRFICIDMDCVVTGDVTPILKRREAFIMNGYQNGGIVRASDQVYNGSIQMMTAGARRNVWDSFDYETSPPSIQNRNDRIGSDQAWIREVLGPNEATFGPKDGIYEARLIGETLPKDARLVFFSGKRDPTSSRWAWVKEHYK